jgi:uncharacterized protein with FMN-binding domain
MRKYLQITIVLGAFFSLVFIKSLHLSDEEENIQVGTNNNIPKQVQYTPTAQETNPPISLSETSSSSISPTPQPRGQYKDGTYLGNSEFAYYGNIQIKVVVKNGKINDIVFLDHPKDNRTSNFINSQAMPMLIAEAISAQNANIDIISGASYSSGAFQKSLESALNQAK